MRPIEKPPTVAGITGEGLPKQTKETIGARRIAQPVRAFTAKSTSPSLAPLPCPKSCNRCRDLVRRLAIYVAAPDGPAFNLCRGCFIAATNREAAEGIRRRFNELFVRLRPYLTSGRGAVSGRPGGKEAGLCFSTLRTPGFTFIDRLLARALVLAFFGEDFDEEIALARAIARSEEGRATA